MSARSKRKHTWTGNWPIPKTINLPGLRIDVKFKSASEMAEDGAEGLWVYDPEEGYARIYLSKDDPIEEQRFNLIHEMGHALVDYVRVMIKWHPRYVRVMVRDDEDPISPASGETSKEATQ